MKKLNITGNYDKLVGYFETRLDKIRLAHNKTSMFWGDLLLWHNKQFELPKDAVIQAYWDLTHLKQSVEMGYRTLMSSAWYLDHLGVGWQDFYKAEPYSASNFTDAQKKLILGGETLMWTENVDDNNVDSRIYPKMVAVAERLWSPMNVVDINNATARLEEFRCEVLVRRGVACGPVWAQFQRHACDAMIYKKPW
jgi:hexosaminidase